MTDSVQTPRTEPVRHRDDRLRRALFRFSQSKLSMIGAAIVAVVLFFAVFGTVLAPFPGHVAGGSTPPTSSRPLPPPICSAPTSWDRTCFRW